LFQDKKVNPLPFILMSALGVVLLWLFLPKAPHAEVIYRPFKVLNLQDIQEGENDIGLFLATSTYYLGIGNDGSLGKLVLNEEVLSHSSERILYKENDFFYDQKINFLPRRLKPGTIEPGVFFRRQKAFILKNQGFTLDVLNDDLSNLIQSFNFASPVVAVDESQGLIAVGTLGAEVLNSRGEVVSQIQPAGSRYSVLYNLALSPVEGNLMTISGQEPKRFILWDRQNGIMRPYLSWDMKDERLFPTHLAFLDKERFGIFQDGERVVLVDPASKKLTSVPIQGLLFRSWFDSRNNLIVLLSKERNQGHLYFLTERGELKGEYAFEGSLEDGGFIHGQIFLALGDKVLILDQEGK